MEKYGYKCFNEDMTNRYGQKMEIGKIYSTTKSVKFGNDGNGYHFCKNMEDTFRYFDAIDGNISICYVKGFGTIDEYEDDYNGYYDMYAAENLEIIKKLSREEIIEYGLNLPSYRVVRFVQTFKLSDSEIKLFMDKFSNSMDALRAIRYYQLNDKDAYKIK